MMTDDAPVPPWDSPPLDFAQIVDAIANIEPGIMDPFNGATRVFLSADTYAAIVPHLHPFDKRRIAFEQRAMPPGYGVGFRPSQSRDHPDRIVEGYGTLVFTLTPKART